MADPTDPKELARALRETVWQYNVERSELCGENLYTDVDVRAGAGAGVAFRTR